MERRKFIAAGLAGTSIACSRGARSAWRFFTVAEGRAIEAACGHIIPVDRDPGAVEAGAAVFIDRQLTGHYKEYQTVYRNCIAALDRQSVAVFGRAFADAPPEVQLEVLKRIEQNPRTKPFFELLVAHTMQGFYGSPRHGGNRGRASWKMLGVAGPPVRGRA